MIDDDDNFYAADRGWLYGILNFLETISDHVDAGNDVYDDAHGDDDWRI